MAHWTGFADLSFTDSARLAFARALDRAETDVDQAHPDAWVIEDRHVAFAFDGDTSRQIVDATKRLLDALVVGAIAGEATLEIDQPRERWTRKAGPSISKEIALVDEDYEGAGETIRTAAS